MKRILIVTLVVLVALAFAAPVAAQDEEPVVEKVAEVVEEAPVEGPDLDEISSSVGELLILVVVGFLYVITNEVAFERLISVPIIEGIFKGNATLKKWQPLMVLGAAVVLAGLAKVDLWGAVGELTPIVTGLPGDGNFVATGAIAAFLAMIWHEKGKV